MPKFVCHLFHGASSMVTVEAETPEEAEEEAHNQNPFTSLCHQCNDEIEVGDVYAVTVYDEGEMVEVLNTDPDKLQIAKLQAELAAMRGAEVVQADIAPGIKLCVDHVENKAQEFAEDFGSDDLGSVSFGTGLNGEIKLDYYNDLRELADELRALLATSQGEA